jgi:hypothetical protein
MNWFGWSVIGSAIPAAPFILVGTLIATRRKKPHIFPFELVAWLLPGILYWMLLEPLGLEQAFLGKSMGNVFAEPLLIGLLTGVLFLLRLAAGAKRPEKNLAAAWSCIVYSVLASVVVFTLVPGIE